MVDAPRQNWKAYEQATAASDASWVRKLSSQERFSLYADLFDLLLAARHGQGNWQRLDQWAWQQKLRTRMKLVEAYRKWDRHKRARAVEKNAG